MYAGHHACIWPSLSKARLGWGKVHSTYSTSPEREAKSGRCFLHRNNNAGGTVGCLSLRPGLSIGIAKSVSLRECEPSDEPSLREMRRRPRQLALGTTLDSFLVSLSQDVRAKPSFRISEERMWKMPVSFYFASRLDWIALRCAAFAFAFALPGSCRLSKGLSEMPRFTREGHLHRRTEFLG